MNINYQVMGEEQVKAGKYYPDWAKLIEGATCAEEIEYINSLLENEQKWIKSGFKPDGLNFVFNMVYVARQACGHFEIFQTPCSEQYHPLEEKLALAEKDMLNRKCTHCICR